MLRSLSLTRVLLAGLCGMPLILAACDAPSASNPEPTAPPVDTYVAHRDAEFGVPTFVWLDGEPDPQGDAKAIAWRLLRQLAPTYGLNEAALQTARLARVHDTGRGAVIAQFEQEVDGIEVFRRTLNIALSPEHKPVGATGYLAGALQKTAADFALSAEDAVARAIVKMTNAPAAPPIGTGDTTAAAPGYRAHTVATFVAGSTRYREATPARSKRVWYPAAKGLVPAYYVELDLSIGDQPDSSLRSYIVSATDGSILLDNDMVQYDAYNYRVWADKDGGLTPWDGPHGNAFTPHPTGLRDNTSLTFVPSQVVRAANAPFSKNDPWLPAAATEARGNNAVAYADIVAPDGFGTGDVMLKPNMSGDFDYSLDVSKDNPAANATTIQAVTTNFFFIVNYLHDTYYDAGWDETSRNPQKDNFGRGGVANDPIRAESQDNSGRNNANASTPADGSSPRIQMYLFDPAEDAVRVTAPTDLAKTYGVGRAAFGPKTFDVSRDLVLVNDGMGMSPSDGCETPFVNAAAVADKIAVIDRGDCFFELKVYNAQVSGAKGAIIVNNVPDAPGSMAAGSTPPPMPVTIPSVLMAQADGNAIKAKLAAGTAVSMTLRALMVNNDSSLDGMIVSHEWGHVMSNRLIGNGSGLINNQGRSMGEGWSDFVALLMTTRAEDAMAAANADWKGAFAAAAYSTGPGNNSAYEGIRRYPYSADLAKNPLMFRHIADGVALPMVPRPAFGQDGASNSEVHNSGEVWTSALWECYVALLKDTARYTFAQASQRMREYLVAGFKLTPLSPTMIEARDAVLLAAMARDAKDFELFARAFAKRGMGVGAVSPPRSSIDHTGVVESTAVGGAISIESVTLTDTGKSCDNDGILDEGELGLLTIKVRNTGTLPFTARATISTESGIVTFPRGNTMTFTTARPYQTATATLLVALRGAPAQAAFSLKAMLTAADLAVAAPVSVRRSFVGNYDLVPGSSASDTMDDPSTAWTPGGDMALETSEPWKHVREGVGGRYAIPDHAAPSDQWLVSAPLQVSTTGSFGFSLSHRYSFEYDTTAFYDGGVIEISTDDGKTWTDTAAQLVSQGYNGTLWAQNAPLKSRKAFVGVSPGYPAYVTTVADFGTAHQGKTVRLRLRVGTDPAIGGPGWDVDSFSVTGTTNTPFPSRQFKNACRP